MLQWYKMWRSDSPGLMQCVEKEVDGFSSLIQI